jgi:ribonuclease HI
MELRAVIEGLRALKQRCNVVIRTDSKYVNDGITVWIVSWEAQGWVHKVKRREQPVKNRELWEEINRLTRIHHVKSEWLRGHADDADNIRCHELANTAARNCASRLR